MHTDKTDNKSEQIFNQYVNALHKISWKYAERYGMEEKDLFQEACLFFFHVIDKYNEERASLCTFIHTVISNKMKAIAKKEVARRKRIQDQDQDQENDDYSCLSQSDYTPNSLIWSMWAEEQIEKLPPEEGEVLNYGMSLVGDYQKKEAKSINHAMFQFARKQHGIRKSRQIIRNLHNWYKDTSIAL